MPSSPCGNLPAEREKSFLLSQSQSRVSGVSHLSPSIRQFVSVPSIRRLSPSIRHLSPSIRHLSPSIRQLVSVPSIRHCVAFCLRLWLLFVRETRELAYCCSAGATTRTRGTGGPSGPHELGYCCSAVALCDTHVELVHSSTRTHI